MGNIYLKDMGLKDMGLREHGEHRAEGLGEYRAEGTWGT